MSSERKCVICNDRLPSNVHEQHTAAPVKQGRCCSYCNLTVVIPARIAGLPNMNKGS